MRIQSFCLHFRRYSLKYAYRTALCEQQWPMVCVLWACCILHASSERLIHVSFHVTDGHVIGCDIYLYFYFRSASHDALQCFVFRRSHFRISERNYPAWRASGFVSVLLTKCLDRTPHWATTALYTFWLMNYWPCDIWGARSGADGDSSLSGMLHFVVGLISPDFGGWGVIIAFVLTHWGRGF